MIMTNDAISSMCVGLVKHGSVRLSNAINFNMSSLTTTASIVSFTTVSMVHGSIRQPSFITSSNLLFQPIG
eukprot:2011094-Prorocentrum_lima.AAC.1